MKTTKSSSRSVAAFSLIELLVVVAVLAVIGAVAVVSLTPRNALVESKLEQDVARLNGAIKIYIGNGGSMDGIETAQQAVDQLKRAADADGQERVVGLRGSMVDHRLEAVSEVQGGERTRAVWKPEQKKFVLEVGTSGVSEFRMNEALGSQRYVAAERDTSLDYNPEAGWIWTSADVSSGGFTGPTGLPTTNTPTLGAISGTAAANRATLVAPTISPDSGVYPLSLFPLEVTISKDATTPVDAKIWYTVQSGVWEVYTEPFTVEPGTVVAAYVSSPDPAWNDSPRVAASYDTDPEALEIEVWTPVNPITYVEAGGEVEPGNYTPTEPVGDIEVFFPGGWEIPDVYEDSEQFQFFWTMDGSDPRSSITRVAGITFQNGYKNNNGHGNNESGVDISNKNWVKRAEQEGWTQEEIEAFAIDDEKKPHDKISYSISTWGDATLMPIRVVAEAKNKKLMSTSLVLSSNISINRTKLRQPKFVIPDDPQRGDTVEISLEVDYGDMPVGARVYYTTDGTDPGDDGTGNPITGTLYTGPFDPLLGRDIYDGEVIIIARVYPPEDHLQWFDSSYSSSGAFIVPTWDVTGEATGWFIDESGNLANYRDDTQGGSYFYWSSTGGDAIENFADISNRERFQIGQLSYHNGSGYVASDGESFDFAVQLDLDSISNQFNYQINQYITYNTGTAWENADTIQIDSTLSTETINLFGANYALNLEFGESSAGGSSSLDQFTVLEGETATAALYGTLVSLDSWW